MNLQNRSKQKFERGFDGELLPAKVVVLNAPDKKEWETWMIPLTVGDISEFKISDAFSRPGYQIEHELIQRKFMFDGSFLTLEETQMLRFDWVESLISTIMYHSGFALKDIAPDHIPERFRKKQTEFQKQVTSKIKKQGKHSKLVDFLHEKGIRYFDIPRLCYFEIEQLVEGHNANNKIN